MCVYPALKRWATLEACLRHWRGRGTGVCGVDMAGALRYHGTDICSGANYLGRLRNSGDSGTSLRDLSSYVRVPSAKALGYIGGVPPALTLLLQLRVRR